MSRKKPIIVKKEKRRIENPSEAQLAHWAKLAESNKKRFMVLPEPVPEEVIAEAFDSVVVRNIKGPEEECTVCHAPTKFIGGDDYDIEPYACTKCGAVHNMRLQYQRGIKVSSFLESII
jgi:hypothetical protein